MKLVIEILPETSELEKPMVHLENLNEKHRDALVSLEVNKHCMNVQYDKYVHPLRYSEGELVILYDQASEP